MVCCDKCNKAYMSEFDGYLCLRIFFEKKGYNSSRDVVPNLNSLTFSYDLDKYELDIVTDVLSKFYDIDEVKEYINDLGSKNYDLLIELSKNKDEFKSFFDKLNKKTK